MEPRLPESKKWTGLPKELEGQIKEALAESFPEPAKVGKFSCEGRIYKSEILIRLGYLANGRLAQANAEVSVEYNFKKENPQQVIGFAVDAAGSLLDSYFTNPDEDFPREWKSFKLENKEVYLKFTTDNSDLEAEADKLLGVDSQDGLVRGDVDSETVDAIKASLGVGDDSDDSGDGTTH